MAKRFVVLDSYRGLLAFIVAIYHYKASGPIGQLAIFKQGDYFVDFFFVLSGFIIYYNYSQLSAGKPQVQFIKNRLYRLYPLHITMLLTFLVMEMVKYSLNQQGIFKSPAFDKNNLTAFTYNVFFMQSFCQISAGWNYPSWSISAEMVTYVIFCLLIVYLNRSTLRSRAVGFLAVSVGSLAMIYILKGDYNIKMTTNFSMFRCMYGFFAGCLTYELYQIIIRSQQVQKQFITALEFIVLSGSLLLTAYLPKEMSFLLPVTFALCVLVFSLEVGTLSKLLNNKLFGKVGELSYSIYMTHAAIAIVFEIALSVLKINSPAMLSIGLVVYLVTIFQIAKVTHQYIEIRFRKWLQNQQQGTFTRSLIKPERARMQA